MGLLVGLTFCLVGAGEGFGKMLLTNADGFTYKGIEIWYDGVLIDVLNTDNFVDDYATIVLEYYSKYAVTLDESFGIYWDSMRSGKKLFV